jgi:hypothetical protein
MARRKNLNLNSLQIRKDKPKSWRSKKKLFLRNYEQILSFKLINWLASRSMSVAPMMRCLCLVNPLERGKSLVMKKRKQA